MNRWRFRGRFVFFTIMLLIMVLFAHIKLWEYAYDDAYIHFRIIENYLSYNQPYFNLNEPVNGSSSIGWIIFLSSLMKIISIIKINTNILILTAILNSILLLASGLMFTQLLGRLLPENNRVLFYGSFLLWYVSINFGPSVGRMETLLALFGAGLGLLALYDRKNIAFLILAIVVFIRLELIVLYLVAFFWVVMIKKENISNVLIFTCLGGSPFILFEIYYYQSIIPQSVIAKSRVYDVPIAYNLHLTLLLVVITFLAVRKILPLLSKHATYSQYMNAIVLVWGLGVMGGYILSNSLIFLWYVPLFSVPLLFFLATQYSDLLGRYTSNFFRIGFWLVTVLLGLHFARQVWSAVDHPGYFSDFPDTARGRKYIKVGEILYEQCPKAKVMAPEIGGLGYGFQGYIYDGVGLVSPEALNYYQQFVPDDGKYGRLGSLPLGFIEAKKPDVIVSYDCFAQEIINSPILFDYEVEKTEVYLLDDIVQTGRTNFLGCKELLIMYRKDGVCSVR